MLRRPHSFFLPAVVAFILAHSVASQDAPILAWGSDGYGAVSDTPTSADFVEVAIGWDHGLALKVDGSIVSWGRDDKGQVTNTPSGNDFVQVAGGALHSLALKSDGSIISWGYDGFGLVSSTPSGTDFVQVTAGANDSHALKADGSIVSWGRDAYGAVGDTPGGSGFVKIVGTSNGAIAIRSDSSIVAWGDDGSGQVSNAPTGTGFVQVAGGVGHSLGLKSDGSIASWGSDDIGRISNTPPGAGFVQVSEKYQQCLALKADGSIVVWGVDWGDTPEDVGLARVRAGKSFSLAFRGVDSDQDFLPDIREDVNGNGQVDAGETDALDQDTDDDGLSDGEEAGNSRVNSSWLQGPSGNFYRLAPPMNWSQASASARSGFFELASVHDEIEAKWLSNTFGSVNGSFWIGLHDFAGTFEWTDGSPVSYTRWAAGEPNTSFVAAYVGGPSSAERGFWYTEFGGVTPRPSVWEASGPEGPMTITDPLTWDSDYDSLSDGLEDGIDQIVWDGDLDGDGNPDVRGTDPAVFSPDAHPSSVTDPLDQDSDDDGISDGTEDANANGMKDVSETDGADPDTDEDGLPDGLEIGLTFGTLDTDGNVFIADSDPGTTTDPILIDTDGGGVPDGVEDHDRNGALNSWDTDPTNPGDEAFAVYLSGVIPGSSTHIEVWNGTPFETIIPAYSLSGSGPSATSIGLTLDLTRPIFLMNPFLTNGFGRGSVDGLSVPLTAPPGLPVWFQAVEIPLGSVLPPRASNPILIPIGAN